MTIEICVPAYNEEATIVDALRELDAALPSELSLTITVAENGSTDRTSEVVEAAQFSRVQLLRVNGKGKGLAIRTAAAVSQADIFGFIDADLSANPAIIPEFIERIQSGADIVIGSRMLDLDRVNRGALRTFTSRVFNLITRLLFGIKHRDTQCGLKFMNVRARQLFLIGEESGWNFDVEFLARGIHHGMRIDELPVEWKEFRYPERKSKLNVIRDGCCSIIAMIRIRQRLNTSKQL